MRLVYMAHPFGGEAANLKRARRWFVWLLRNFGDRHAFVANWILECEALDDRDPLVREQALQRDELLAGRCDACVLVGGHMSVGMQREASVVWGRGCPVYDLTSLGNEPPRWAVKPWLEHELPDDTGLLWTEAGKALRGLAR